MNKTNRVNTNIRKITKKIYPILQRYDIARAAIFGSFARGENKKDSDIDILVKFKGKKSLFDLAGLKRDLEETLKREVNVFTYNCLHPLIKQRILNEQRVIL